MSINTITNKGSIQEINDLETDDRYDNVSFIISSKELNKVNGESGLLIYIAGDTYKLSWDDGLECYISIKYIKERFDRDWKEI